MCANEYLRELEARLKSGQPFGDIEDWVEKLDAAQEVEGDSGRGGSLMIERALTARSWPIPRRTKRRLRLVDRAKPSSLECAMLRELDQRTSDGLITTLFWDPEVEDGMWLRLHDQHSGATDIYPIPADKALDALRHPFRYESAREAVRT